MKKSTKYSFTVDLTQCESGIDVILSFIDAKVDTGVAITRFEYNALLSYLSEDMFKKTMCEIINDSKDTLIDIATSVMKNIQPEKKPNMFKRFWNWMTGKK